MAEKIVLRASAPRCSTQCFVAAMGVAAMALLSCANVANADPQATPTRSATISPGLQDAEFDHTPASLPEVTVEATRAALERRVDAFVHGVTRNPGYSETESLVRWNAPVCLFAGGLAAEEVKFVLTRLSQITSSAGAPLAGEPCQPNFIIIATSEPDRVLKAWYARNSQLFGNAPLSKIRHFLDPSQSRPIRVWYNINLGRTATMRNGHFIPSNVRAESSAFVRNAILGFSSIFAVIDTNRTEHAKLGQLADYVAMAGLTNIDLDADIESAPSILRLFASSAEISPPGLSSWDMAFLKALYQSDQTSRTQRVEIANRVFREVSR